MVAERERGAEKCREAAFPRRRLRQAGRQRCRQALRGAIMHVAERMPSQRGRERGGSRREETEERVRGAERNATPCLPFSPRFSRLFCRLRLRLLAVRSPPSRLFRATLRARVPASAIRLPRHVAPRRRRVLSARSASCLRERGRAGLAFLQRAGGSRQERGERCSS